MHHSLRRPERARGALRFALSLTALGLAACTDEWGNGERAFESREHGDFSAIDHGGELDVRVEQGERFEVVVAIDENLIDRVETRVVDDELRISTRGQIGNLVKGPHVRVTMPVLSAARVSGAGDLGAHGFVDSEAVELRVSGAGDISWQGEALEIEASVSGAGDLRLEGHTESLDLRVSGAGDANARGCPAESARVEVDGAGDATVDVRGELDAEVSGSGDLEVYGDPHFSRRVRSGAGDIDTH
jgi:hypothetical protein